MVSVLVSHLQFYNHKQSSVAVFAVFFFLSRGQELFLSIREKEFKTLSFQVPDIRKRKRKRLK